MESVSDFCCRFVRSCLYFWMLSMATLNEKCLNRKKNQNNLHRISKMKNIQRWWNWINIFKDGWNRFLIKVNYLFTTLIATWSSIAFADFYNDLFRSCHELWSKIFLGTSQYNLLSKHYNHFISTLRIQSVFFLFILCFVCILHLYFFFNRLFHPKLYIVSSFRMCMPLTYLSCNREPTKMS